MPKPDDVGVGTALFILNEDGHILMGKRKGAHRAGHWCVPGGWLDREDPSTDIAIIRETKEETDLEVRRVDPLCWTTEDHPEIGIRTVTLYHVTGPGWWDGDPEVMEPEKCEEWRWVSLSDIPSPLFPGLMEAVEALTRHSLAEVLR